VDAISWVHQHKLFHGSVSSSHILWNSDQNVIKLIDFGLCSDLAKDNVGLSQQLSGGSDKFVCKSPEQTGRMNREVDYRTDLYSLGISISYLLLISQVLCFMRCLRVRCHLMKNLH
jgi:histidine kinase